MSSALAWQDANEVLVGVLNAIDRAIDEGRGGARLTKLFGANEGDQGGSTIATMMAATMRLERPQYAGGPIAYLQVSALMTL